MPLTIPTPITIASEVSEMVNRAFVRARDQARALLTVLTESMVEIERPASVANAGPRRLRCAGAAGHLQGELRACRIRDR